MATNYPKQDKTYTSVLISVLLVFILFAGIAALKNSAIFGPAFASENHKSQTNQTQADSNQPSQDKPTSENNTPRPEHNHPAFAERSKERQRMVAGQIQARRIHNSKVLAALRTVPRHAFVRKSDQRRAYSDQPLPIGLGQTISQPYIVAYMTDKLKLTPDSNVLEIGTGSGYQAAVCAEIAKKVYTIEIIPQLARSAKKRLKTLGYSNVTVKAADGYFGWAEKAPFDSIIVTAVAGLVPPPLIDQLKPGGRMILPLGSPYGVQTLVLITKDSKGKVRSRSFLPVRFVPMVGRVMESKPPAKR